MPLAFNSDLSFRDLAIDFEYSDMTGLDEIYHHVLVVYFSRSNPVPRMLCAPQVSGTKYKVAILVACKPSYFLTFFLRGRKKCSI